ARVLIDVVIAVARKRVHPDHDALRAEAAHELVHEWRTLERGRVARDPVRSGVEERPGVRELADAAGDAERDVQDSRDAMDPAAVDGAAVRARRDVVEDELVCAFVAITLRELEDVAHHSVVAELHSFHDLTVANVETRDDSLRQ